MSIRIPAALAAEVAANPERFKPHVEVGQRVIVLARFSGYEGTGGLIGEVLDIFEGTSGMGVTVGTGSTTVSGFHVVQSALAWAVIGSATEPDSRPTTGGRVLALAAARVSAADARIGTVVEPGPSGQILVDFQVEISNGDVEHHHWMISEWAILPPALPAPPVQETPDRRASVVELADVLDEEFGELRPGETAVRGAIRVMREQRAQLADLRAKLDAPAPHPTRRDLDRMEGP